MTSQKTIKNINISAFDYDLPEEKIAKYPLENRDQSKLLIYKQATISESVFSRIPELLEPGDLLVFNNTKVIPARIKFRKETGAAIEIFCLEPHDPADYAASFHSHGCTWKCLTGNLKKWKDNTLKKTIRLESGPIELVAEKINDDKTHQLIRFSWNNPKIRFEEIIEHAGETPIPPYLNRQTEEIDKNRYQTVYSKIKGSVAAPTAGLHFTSEVLSQLKMKGVSLEELTLHVGAGTFKPVQTEDATDHEMHSEYFMVSRATLENLIDKYPGIVAVGTTTLRTLESIYWMGIKYGENDSPIDPVLHIHQWEPYQLPGSLSYPDALKRLLGLMDRNHTHQIVGNTQIMIVPGYPVKSIKALVTNFHQPKSTLLLLVSAITGESWKTIYQYALSHNFRFLSYGDSSILFLP